MMNFKKLAYVIAGVGLAAFTAGSAVAFHGNGLPHGSKNGKFQLNVIAFENCPAGDFTDSERHMIAVEAGIGDIDFDAGTTSNQAGAYARDLIKNNTIELAPSMDGKFHLTDGNACGTGKSSASIELPITTANCDPCDLSEPEFTEYQVFVRLVGAPNTGIGAATCATEAGEDEVLGTIDDIIICSTESVVELRTSGRNSKPRYTDYSKELLTMVVDLGDGLERVALFDPRLLDYFWQWNTKGKAHAQLVFIPVANIVN
jgi:hypothetical protein